MVKKTKTYYYKNGYEMEKFVFDEFCLKRDEIGLLDHTKRSNKLYKNIYEYRNPVYDSESYIKDSFDININKNFDKIWKKSLNY